ncbi:MAG: carbon storage regulator [Planctomycetota bacterium]
MLVLSRREGEGFNLPQIGVSVKVLGRNGGRTVVGIEAPKDIVIVRDELADRAPATGANSVTKTASAGAGKGC